MPKKYDWKDLYVKEFNNREKFFNYVDINLNAIIDKSNKTNCTVCSENSNASHKMEVIYLLCNAPKCNLVDLCEVRYKVNHCLNNDKYFFSQLNKHDEDYEPEVRSVPTRRGLTPEVKKILDHLMYECDISLPKRLEKKLHNKYKSEIEENENEVMPSLAKIQNYIKSIQRNLKENNNLDDIKSFYENNKYSSACEDDDFFCFGSQFGTGTDDSHFQLAFSSINMLRNVVGRELFHFDATYRILKLCYPVLVFGVSDINRKFFPIAFMITSHETDADYVNFFESLKDMTKTLNFEFNPRWILIDASKAGAKAIKSCFPNCVICMCYFHLKYNIRKRKSSLGKYYNKIMKHITVLHNCQNPIEFRKKLKLIIDKWKSWKLTKFSAYFLKQWVFSPFKNWQLYSTPVGYATTNNPIEQYNAIIKKFFTNRLKLNIVAMLKIFTEVIQYESSKIINYKFSVEKIVDSTLISEARNLDIKQFFQTTLNEDEEEGDFIYNYRHN